MRTGAAALVLILPLVAFACSLREPAMTALFYQPQRSDRAWPESRWPGMFARVRAVGFDTLVVQWTQYGDAFAQPSDPEGYRWLIRRLREARAARLKLVVGLAGDPDYFNRLDGLPPDQRAAYLGMLASADLVLARRLLADLGGVAPDGWYLPAEIDDLHWLDPLSRRALTGYLAHEVRQLDELGDRRPVYASAFFSGRMPPGRLAGLLGEVRASGINVWLQDGAGTSLPDAAVRGRFLAMAGPCSAAGTRGLVFEVFRQLRGRAQFAAEPLPPKAMARALRLRAPCRADSVFFELRYLPFAQWLRSPGGARTGSPGAIAAGTGSVPAGGT